MGLFAICIFKKHTMKLYIQPLMKIISNYTQNLQLIIVDFVLGYFWVIAITFRDRSDIENHKAIPKYFDALNKVKPILCLANTYSIHYKL